jgi:ankyrin repeat protein
MRALLMGTVVLVVGCFGASGIHKYVGNEDMKEVRKYVETGGDINARDSGKHTPLIVAAYYGYTPGVRYLCERKADVNARDAEGRTALIWAAYYGHAEIIYILLKSGADPNVRDTSGLNALAYVEKHNWGGGMAELLIAHGSGPAYVK